MRASRFAALAGNARAFMGSLQRALHLHDVEGAVFRTYKDCLSQYAPVSARHSLVRCGR
ncbi:DUF2397 family protein [Streptomyces caniferus]|uniref:DUF2397 family protein n=1 Tax=Streptomyces caniferus TaxID=285557 RepID=A0ABZ1VI29_9ACTN|nr:hypothetical protein [Streptomyces caniferus]